MPLQILEASETTGLAAIQSSTNMPAGYLSFPVELLIMICTKANPKALLQLARTNKWLYDIINGPAFENYWKSALDCVPPPPDGTSLLQYAHLALETHCHNCETSKVICKVYWVARKRLCKDCFGQLFQKNPKCPKGIDKPSWRLAMQFSALRFCLPSQFVYRGTIATITKALLHSKDQMYYVTHTLADRPYDRYSEPFETLYNKHAAEKAAIDHDRRRREDAIIDDRLRRIVIHLEEVGYKAALADRAQIRALRGHPLVNVARVWDNNEWPQIHAGLIKYMEDLQYVKILGSRLQKLSTMLHQMHEDLPDILPQNYIDIALLPEVQQVLDVGPDTTPSDSALADLLNVIPAALTRWRQRIDSELAEKFPRLMPIFENQKTLDHPAAVFVCKKCFACEREPITYAALLPHSCCTAKFTTEILPSNLEGSVYSFAAQWSYKCKPWSAKTLDVHRTSNKVKEMMLACGVNPDTASWDEMDRKDLRVRCVTCETKVRGVTMTWRTAVHHALFDHPSRTPIKWAQASEAVSAYARKLEKDTKQLSRKAYRDMHVCLACPNRVYCMPASRIEDHFRRNHGPSLPVLNRNYKTDPEAYPYVPLPVAVLPLRKGKAYFMPTELEWRKNGRAGPLRSTS